MRINPADAGSKQVFCFNEVQNLKVVDCLKAGQSIQQAQSLSAVFEGYTREFSNDEGMNQNTPLFQK
jgi:hypothetical protein